MKILMLLFGFQLSFVFLPAQDLKFDKRFAECEDHWVAFPITKDSSYPFGFIYIDAQAGLTFDYSGTFKISADGKYVITSAVENSKMKYRLQPNNNRVAFIPESKFGELNVQAVPDWLKIYKGDTTSVKHLYRWGYLYNEYNECAKALTYLEKAYQLDKNNKELIPEIAFSYNCLEQYDKAINFLQERLKEDPLNAYIHKELIYAQTKKGDLEAAAASCRKAIEVCKDESYHGENCYNLLYSFYSRKDKNNFNKWVEEAKKWNKNKPDLLKNIEKMQEDMK